MTKVDYAEDGVMSALYWCEVCQAYFKEYMEPLDECSRGELARNGGPCWEEMRMEIEDEEAK